MIEFENLVDWYGFKACPWNLPRKEPGIYLILNLLSGKVYVGVGQNLERRLRGHASGGSPTRLKNAIKKYGKQYFKVEPIFYSFATQTPLESFEADLIVDYDSIGYGYNVIVSFGEVSGHLFSEMIKKSWENPEIREKRRLGSEKARNSPEGQANHRNAMANPSVRKRISDGLKLAHTDPEVKARHQAARLEIASRPGYSEKQREVALRPEVRKKKSKAIIEALSDPAIRAKRSGLQIARMADPILKEIYVGGWKDPEIKAERAIAIKTALSRPETKQKRAKFHKEHFLITDGKVNIYHKRDEEIPVGWYPGKTNKEGDKTYSEETNKNRTESIKATWARRRLQDEQSEKN